MGIARIRKKLKLRLWKLGRIGSWRRIPLRLRATYIAPERPRRFPLRFQIEATSKCNLICPSCSHSREKDAGEHLTEEVFRRILDRLPRLPETVILSGI